MKGIANELKPHTLLPNEVAVRVGCSDCTAPEAGCYVTEVSESLRRNVRSTARELGYLTGVSTAATGGTELNLCEDRLACTEPGARALIRDELIDAFDMRQITE